MDHGEFLKEQRRRIARVIREGFKRRLSGDERLTLVILPGADPQPTLWSISTCENLEEAIENLRIREKTNVRHIHGLEKEGTSYGSYPQEIRQAVAAWLERHPVDAAIWTGLPSNWSERKGSDFSPELAVAHLESLVREGKHMRAKEYIRRAPVQVRTRVRSLAERQLGWTPK